MPARLRLLVVEDSVEDAALIVRVLRHGGFDVEDRRAETGEGLEAALAQGPYDLAVVDFVLPRFDGFRAVMMVKERCPDLPVIVVSGKVGEDVGVQAMKAGADDFLVKTNLLKLVPIVDRELRQSLIRRERTGAREDGRRAVERWHSIVESAPVGILMADGEGWLVEANPELIRMLGYGSREELLAANPGREVFQDEADLHRLRDEARGESGFRRVEVRWKRKDGTLITVLLSGRSVCDPAGLAGAWEAFAEDVTDLRELEERARRAQHTEAVARLAGGVAHDFNNLLVGVLGYAELLQQALPEGSPPRAHADEILQAGRRAETLTRQLLAFGRRQALQPRVMNLNGAVSDASRAIQRIVGDGVRLEMVLFPALQPVMADPGQVEQVLLHLAAQARDSMPAGGRLVIETAPVRVEERRGGGPSVPPPGAWGRLSVSDTGGGMDAETAARVFEPFASRGGGLGLATVEGIVVQSGGHVAVETAPGRGTTFLVYLPLVEKVEEEARVPGERAPEPSRGTETVLLAEDEDLVRTLVRSVLQGAGYSVLETRDGEEALSLARERKTPIHLLLTDMVMPRMNGRVLVERLREFHPEARVLVMSGYSDEIFGGSEGLPAGADFLPKPFAPAALAQKVREVLDR